MSTRKSRAKKQAPPTAPALQAISSINSPASVASGSAEEDDGAGNQSPRHGRKQSEQKRRILMNQYFDEVVMLLSLISEKSIPKRLDKVSTLKEAVNCMKIYHDLTLCKSEDAVESTIDKSPSPPAPLSNSSTSSFNTGTASPRDEDLSHLLKTKDMLKFFLDSYDTFLMVVSETGRIIFTTEMVTSLLGHMQSRLVGQNLLDFVHDRDKSVIQGLFDSADQGDGVPIPDSPILVYPSVAFTALLQLYVGETSCFPQYLPFKCVSFLRRWKQVQGLTDQPPSPSSQELDGGGMELSSANHQSFIILIGKLPTSLALLDLSIGTNDVNFEFEMRVSREGRIVDIDKHAILVMGFGITELLGTLFFEYIDPYHVTDVGESLGRFLSTGLGSTTPYRIRTKGGRYIWIISKGYLSYNPWNNKPDHILLANQVLGCDQVLPEHRFFRNRNHLPDLEGREFYTPNLNEPANVPNASMGMSVASMTNPVFTQSQRAVAEPMEQELPMSFNRERASSSGRSIQENNALPLGSVFLGRRDSDSHNMDRRHVEKAIGAEGTAASPMGQNRMSPDLVSSQHQQRLASASMESPVSQDRMGQDLLSSQHRQSLAPVSITTTLSSSVAVTQSQSMSAEHPSTNLGHGDDDMVEDATAVAHKMIQRELEEKTQQLEVMQQQLRDKEEKLKQDQMDFYRFMQQMIQRLPNPSNSTANHPVAAAGFEKDKFMAFMENSDQGGSGMQNMMMSSAGVGAGTGRREDMLGENSLMGGSWQRMEYSQQQDRQSQIESLLHSYPTTSSSSLHRRSAQSQFALSSPGNATPTAPSHSSSSSVMNFSRSGPAYSSTEFISTNSPGFQSSQSTISAADRGSNFAQAPLNFPGNAHEPISLADHNMKFYQQQQQQQQQMMRSGWNTSYSNSPSNSMSRPRSLEFSGDGSMTQNMTEGDLANLLFSPSLPP